MGDNIYLFDVAVRKILQEGTLAWEYNPFHNYRLDETLVYYKDRFYTIKEFLERLGTGFTYNEEKNTILNASGLEVTDWSSLGFDKSEEVPSIHQKGELVDFITEELKFDLNHPILITPAYSYDNSVDLIINDGKNQPKLINSRFSAIGKNKYKIVDRTGNNDTNIYDRGVQFDIDTSLYKTTSKIPEVTFGGLSYGGALKIGNYHFYFKYCDLDGNETEFVAQSGLVSVFLGTSPTSINSGFRNQNSGKITRFILSNLEEAYDYIIVYYTRTTSEEDLSRITEYIKINLKYKISQGKETILDITGFEDTFEVTSATINERLLIYDSAKTSTIALNRLFIGNVTQSNVNHEKLMKLALYIVPEIDDSVQCDVYKLNENYLGLTNNTYYDPRFIYNYTGYWDDEIYRFGIVFINNNNTLTPVYNVRGMYLGQDLINNESLILEDPKSLEERTIPISFNETTYKIDSDYIISPEYPLLENAKGVCYIPHNNSLTSVIGIRFKCHESIILALKELGIKGYFMVRLKRIPTTLCQAYTIGVEYLSHTPMIPINKDEYICESFLNKEETSFIYFDNGKKKKGTGNLLSNDFGNHIRKIDKGLVAPTGAICPDYDVNYPYFNSLFTGSEFTINTRSYNNFPTLKGRLFTASTPKKLVNDVNILKVIGLEDNCKLVGVGDYLFSARAGEAEEAFRFEYIGTPVKKDHGGNLLLRGSFGPYLGIPFYQSAGDLITIKIPEYSIGNLDKYFTIRYNDLALFYPISDRYTFESKSAQDELVDLGTCYRGDCYIVKYTHRLNRNFTDPTTPTNDLIVDPVTWTKNMNFEDDVMKKDDLDKINLGDVNAVNLGMWVTFVLRSDINHSVRSINSSYVDETIKFGHSRGFFPYYPISAAASYKLQESCTFNQGFSASVGELHFAELPNVPYYKDIFSTRIAYSNLQINSAFQNSYRSFTSTCFRDYPITYGEITKILEWEGSLICVLEHGIYKIPVNERTAAGDGPGGTVYINTSNVLPENPIVISDKFGSLWSDSIIKTPTGIYGVDTIAKKIWKVDNNGIELISDLKVLEFLNNNISLTERELTPIIGVRNVKTHYNEFKRDVMFTFYDDISGILEVVWNLCWNEAMNRWVTFYSWVPSFSENIYNLYFSFDRETSKLIAKISLKNRNDYFDHIYLDNTLMVNDSNEIGELKYDLSYGDDVEVSFKFELLQDRMNNNKFFTINGNKLSYIGSYSNFVFSIDEINTVSYKDTTYTYNNGKWLVDKQFLNDKEDLTLIKTLQKLRYNKWKDRFDNIEVKFGLLTKLKVYTLNIRCTPTVVYKGEVANYAEYIANLNANALLTGGYIDRTIAVIPKDHLDALSTDFWKHGLAGIIDIKEDIKPTYWYGKLHPFEFEFIVRDKPDTHKIFDNLLIISNKAEPESFHYEIIGECYEFAKDKENMYIRLEATKELFQNSGYNIEYDNRYKTLNSSHRSISEDPERFDKSTLFPGYYYRLDKLNTIEDWYNTRPDESGKNFKNLSGAELVYNKNLNEFRIWNHSLGVDINKEGLLRGNMQYLEDKWKVLISPINLVLCNEPSWSNGVLGTVGNERNVPIELKQAAFMDDDINIQIRDNNNFISPLDKRSLVLWEDDKVRKSEVKLKDKYIKIRIRYSGKDLAIISAIKTLYSISYA